MVSLQDKQAPIDRELADALITATPETWNSAVMEVERVQQGGAEKFRISISSPEGYKDLIGPTEEIYSGLFKLANVYKEYGNIWKYVKYSVEILPDGSWKYSVDFSY